MTTRDTTLYNMLKRWVADQVKEALDGFRVGVVNGPRQSGKTTLVRQVAEELGGSYFSLDDPAVLSVAREDPARFG